MSAPPWNRLINVAEIEKLQSEIGYTFREWSCCALP